MLRNDGYDRPGEGTCRQSLLQCQDTGRVSNCFGTGGGWVQTYLARCSLSYLGGTDYAPVRTAHGGEAASRSSVRLYSDVTLRHMQKAAVYTGRYGVLCVRIRCAYVGTEHMDNSRNKGR